jgi:hypothetical protein
MCFLDALREPKTFDLRGELYRIFGVDLTNVPGISAITAQTILCEIGTNVFRFRNASAFASWLGLCPENTKWWQSPLYEESPRQKPRCHRPTHGGQLATSCKRSSW